MKLLSVAALTLVLAAPAFAADPAVRLYKAYGPKEDVLIGVTAAELRELASETDPKGPNDIPRKPAMGDADLDTLGDRLVGVGHLKAWQYGPRRGSDGAAEWAPLRRIVLFGAHVYRLEAQSTSDKVVPPAN